MSKYQTGLIVGKFSPLHKGHEFLIRTAQENCAELVIISYSLPEFSGCEAVERREWLTGLFPTANVFVIARDEAKTRYGLDMPGNGSDDASHRKFVCKLWEQFVDRPLDAIYSSETYGDGFALHFSEYFGDRGWPTVNHEMIDVERKSFSVSGTQVRHDAHRFRSMLSPIVYSSFVQTACFIGGESTGKSTITERLAREFGTAFVPEYGRTLWEEKGGKLDFEDLLTIAKTHVRMEDEKRLQANRFLFVDTTPLTTFLYSDWLFEKADDSLVSLAKRKYDHSFLCSPDFPFVQDGSRQGKVFRNKQHLRYIEELSERNIPFVLLEGSLEERIRRVKETLDVQE